MATSQNCTSSGLPAVGSQLTDACCALLLQLLWSFYFFLCEKLLMCVSCYRLVQRLCRVVWLKRASQWFTGLRKCPSELISSHSKFWRGWLWIKTKTNSNSGPEIKVHFSNALRPVCFSWMLLTVLQRGNRAKQLHIPLISVMECQ